MLRTIAAPCCLRRGPVPPVCIRVLVGQPPTKEEEEATLVYVVGIALLLLLLLLDLMQLLPANAHVGLLLHVKSNAKAKSVSRHNNNDDNGTSCPHWGGQNRDPDICRTCPYKFLYKRVPVHKCLGSFSGPL